MKPNVNARSKTPLQGEQFCIDDSVSISKSDASLIREYVQFAIESIEVVIADEMRYRDGNRSPILGTLKRYARDGKALLERLES